MFKGSRIKEQCQFVSENVLKIKLRTFTISQNLIGPILKVKIPLKLKFKKETKKQQDNEMRLFGLCKNYF